ncbi:tetratricopeptide repeat protein [Yinghuangia soli]|uniref:Tetratricopeptide repeat protein n=1 Tax=Yinghuangia soli TaxID=2908204 RepID=A0AA41Q7P9_9ACTN|nr:tetratricopeptide repeat protein [Yinghuangia soli]MCF2531894.1 tetratricopeptide repeat protein [Yinghuangia soli]
MTERFGRRQVSQRGHAGRDLVQIAGDQHVYPAADPVVEWPVWVGEVPKLATAFQPRKRVSGQARKAYQAGRDVVLSGSGGVGKSQLAAFLARELRDQKRTKRTGLDVLVWAPAAGIDQVITAYAEAAAQLRLPGVSDDNQVAAARAFLAWLGGTRRRWMVVLDNIADPAAVQEWWPDTGSGRGWVVAATRRDHAMLSGQRRIVLEVGTYTKEEVAAYVRRRLTDAGYASLYDPGHAGELTRDLGRLPLAVGHAAAYMINKRCTTGDYLARLRRADVRLAELLPAGADTENYGIPVTTSLLLSLDAVEEADTTRLARPLLQLASLTDPLGHPGRLWTTTDALSHLRTARPPRRRWLRRAYPPVTIEQVHSALELLRTYALITQDTADAPIRMHALTARAVRESIVPGRLPAMAKAVAAALAGLWPSHHVYETWELSALLRANTVHLDACTRPVLWVPAVHVCIRRVSRSLTEAGLYRQALAYDEAMVAYCQANLGADNPDTLHARSSLAASYGAVGRSGEALESGERLLADFERVLGADDPDTLGLRHNLANFHDQAGRHQEGLELRKRLLADYERVLGPDHPDTLCARGDLAGSYGAVGRTKKSVNLYERVLDQHERMLGPDHPDTLRVRHNLAVAYGEAGRVQDATELLEQVAEDYDRVLGSDHPTTVNVRYNLALSLVRELDDLLGDD